MEEAEEARPVNMIDEDELCNELKQLVLGYCVDRIVSDVELKEYAKKLQKIPMAMEKSINMDMLLG